MELYECALDKSDDIDRIVSLGALLKKGAEGGVGNVVQAVELYERAIEMHQDRGAVLNLACLLRDGGDGVTRDAARAAKFQSTMRGRGEGEAMEALGQLVRYEIGRSWAYSSMGQTGAHAWLRAICKPRGGPG